MHRLLILILALPSAAAAQVSAEHIFQPGAVTGSLVAGGAAFSAFQYAQRDQHERRIAAQTSPVVGLELMGWISPSWGIRLHGSWIPSRFDVQLDAAGAEQVRAAGGAVSDTTQWRGLSVYVADVAALVRPHFTFGRVAPWLMVGGGLVSYRPSGRGRIPEDAEASFGAGSRTAVAGMVGAGAAVPLQREDFVMTFTLTNHVTRTPIGATPERVRFTSHVRLLVGFTVPLRHQH